MGYNSGFKGLNTVVNKYWLLYSLNTVVNKRTVQGRLEVRTLARERDFLSYMHDQSDPEAHANSCTVGKAAGAWAWDLTPTLFSSEV